MSLRGEGAVNAFFKKYQSCEFPGSPVLRTLCFHYRGHRFNPWSENQDPESTWHGQNKGIKENNTCFSGDEERGSINT